MTPSQPVGVLLVNLGSPEAPTAAALRRYLRQFLSDRRVVTLSPLLWQPLLNLVILPLRAPRSAELYRRVWTDRGPPLIVISRDQRQLLQERLGDGWRVALAMRYGRPSIEQGLQELQEAGALDVVVLSLFPQYAEATVGSVDAAVRRASARRRFRLVTTVPPFYVDDGYLDALVAVQREAVDRGAVDHHVFSFHGLPQRQVDRGDPYRKHCEATAVELARRLGLDRGEWSLVFQSRFGPQPWLQPYADQYVPELAARHARLLVATPGFPTDCLETIDEIGEVLAEQFRAAGGRELRRVPCLNTHPRWIDAMADLVRRQLTSRA